MYAVDIFMQISFIRILKNEAYALVTIPGHLSAVIHLR